MQISSTGKSFDFGASTELFEDIGFIPYGGMAAGTFTGGRSFAVAPDGERFLMVRTGGLGLIGRSAEAAKIIVVSNWIEEVKARVPTN